MREKTLAPLHPRYSRQIRPHRNERLTRRGGGCGVEIVIRKERADNNVHMKFSFRILVLFLAAFGALQGQVLNTNSSIGRGQTWDTNEYRFRKLEDQLAEVRRDQLNYQIEKSLLKETFSSNTQTLTIILSIILGVFTILGFFGLRDLGSVKKDFLDELQKLRELSKQFESKANELSRTQRSVEENYKQLYEKSEDQNKRIKALELCEKVAAIMQAGDYQWALENLAVALSLDPSNVRLLSQKALCLWRLDNLSGALSAYQQALSSDPHDEFALTSCLELSLLLKDFSGYTELLEKNKSFVESRYEGGLMHYFQVLQFFQKGDVEKMRSSISNFLTSAKDEKIKRLGSWDYSDLRKHLTKQPKTSERELLLLFIEVLNGSVSPSELQKKIQNI